MRGISIQNPHQKLRMREFSSQICANQPANLCTVDFQLVVQKLRREFTHAQNFLFKIPAQVRACADSRRDFWTTNWKSTVRLDVRFSLGRTFKRTFYLDKYVSIFDTDGLPYGRGWKYRVYGSDPPL